MNQLLNEHFQHLNKLGILKNSNIFYTTNSMFKNIINKTIEKIIINKKQKFITF